MSSYWEEVVRDMDSNPERWDMQLPAVATYGGGGGVMVGTRDALRKTQNYPVIADVDDMVVGWTHFAPFVRFMVNAPKHKKQVSNVEFCGNLGCWHHLQLLYVFQNDMSQYADDEELKGAAFRYAGQDLPKLPYLKISSHERK
jgi:hypothetical protein